MLKLLRFIAPFTFWTFGSHCEKLNRATNVVKRLERLKVDLGRVCERNSGD